jgi:hypothetical protein
VNLLEILDTHNNIKFETKQICLYNNKEIICKHLIAKGTTMVCKIVKKRQLCSLVVKQQMKQSHESSKYSKIDLVFTSPQRARNAELVRI